ncbi:MAG TPA: hypothetical protein VF039_13540, partial [Longimicrobiales bacterium]
GPAEAPAMAADWSSAMSSATGIDKGRKGARGLPAAHGYAFSGVLGCVGDRFEDVARRPPDQPPRPMSSVVSPSVASLVRPDD